MTLWRRERDEPHDDLDVLARAQGIMLLRGRSMRMLRAFIVQLANEHCAHRGFVPDTRLREVMRRKRMLAQSLLS